MVSFDIFWNITLNRADTLYDGRHLLGLLAQLDNIPCIHNHRTNVTALAVQQYMTMIDYLAGCKNSWR